MHFCISAINFAHKANVTIWSAHRRSNAIGRLGSLQICAKWGHLACSPMIECHWAPRDLECSPTIECDWAPREPPDPIQVASREPGHLQICTKCGSEAPRGLQRLPEAPRGSQSLPGRERDFRTIGCPKVTLAASTLLAPQGPNPHPRRSGIIEKPLVLQQKQSANSSSAIAPQGVC